VRRLAREGSGGIMDAESVRVLEGGVLKGGVVGESVTLHPDIAWFERQPDFRHTSKRKDGRRERGERQARGGEVASKVNSLGRVCVCIGLTVHVVCRKTSGFSYCMT
jgi:hypothetical protein